MPRIKIDNKIVISYDYDARNKYWGALSKYLIKKHGNGHFTDQQKIEEILIDGFDFLVDNFKQLISTEKKISFFLYTHWLHEQSIQIYVKTLVGFKLEKISESEFAMYRRVLKLVLEQGCDIDLEWDSLSTGKEVLVMDDKIQELLYLGTWMYEFADKIAFQKMIEECHQIYFDEEGLLVIDWQYHYGQTYNELFPMLAEDYKKGTFDEQAVFELRAKIEECFKIEYDFASGVIFEIQKHHNPKSPYLQTIEPDVLPLNLIQNYGINKEIAEIFYAGLTISRNNKLTVEEAIRKPHSTKRYIFRPILVYKIEGINRALVGKEKFAESIMVLSTNAIHWNAMLDEWLALECIQTFINKKGNEHDKILEDKTEEIIKEKGFLYCRNVKSFKQASKKNNVNIDNAIAGEIDLIVVNSNQKIIYVADAKYNRARYEAVGYRMDYSQFINVEKPAKSYETKLNKKTDWIRNNLDTLKQHLSIVFNKPNVDLSGYKVVGIFIINTPTFYMFNGNFKAITLKQFGDFIEGKYEYPDLFILDEEESMMMVKHPYFRKPLLLTDEDGNN
ncbi:hypothetical protein LV84_01175 [Algoriphagus ratkowskyi]|uniref:Nuclease-like protein n=1 Tax=Algoriphagus ratkowskyi TaxID=57028 RepID=A0A2W7RX44_9BACT|nr:hypothetical protein [Algoriphagus ratkowskyi]PZX59149.1 hypothetical protein LV84_01175 [Algoriphagus ratkowskyi]TXD77565.1 hypothetical protein ESW18_12275 [Algoriphagus ratkowskyi]